MCHEVWLNIDSLRPLVPSGCTSTHIKPFISVSTCYNHSLKTSFMFHSEKKDYLGGLQESVEKDFGETSYSP